jgi:bla regulator protein blaR1
MLAWILYAMCVSLLLGATAWCVERIFRLLRRPTRWLWMTALLASVIVPSAISFVAIELPAGLNDANEVTLVRFREATAASLSPERWVQDIDIAQSFDADAFLQRTWLLCSLAVSTCMLLVAVYWSRRSRAWPERRVGGELVRVAEDVGPAIVGFLRPRIVLPRWLVDAPSATVDAVLAHEREHLKARDSQLLLASILFICVMPWNLPLWWAVIRLRHAIEVDCDARVLSDGRDAIAYGTLLLDIQQQRVTPALTAVALTERASFLETRIRLLLAVRSPLWRWTAAALGCMCALLIALSIQVSPPDLRGDAAIEVSDADFDRVVGYYHFGGLMLIHVQRSGAKRYAEFTGQPLSSLLARNERSYFSRSPTAEYEFEFDEKGIATRMVLRQNRETWTGRRVSTAQGVDLQQSFTTKLREKTRAPGAEEVVRQLLAELRAGQPNYSRMTREVAETTREFLSGRSAELESYGDLQKLAFVDVTQEGSDVYKATFERGINVVFIQLAPDGRIAHLGFDEWLPRKRRDEEAERFQAQRPLPRSAEALAAFIAALGTGDLAKAPLSPGMYATVAEQEASLRMGLASFGELESIKFAKVLPNGWDVYSVRFSRAVIECSIELREDGKISGILWDM